MSPTLVTTVESGRWPLNQYAARTWPRNRPSFFVFRVKPNATSVVRSLSAGFAFLFVVGKLAPNMSATLIGCVGS